MKSLFSLLFLSLSFFSLSAGAQLSGRSARDLVYDSLNSEAQPALLIFQEVETAKTESGACYRAGLAEKALGSFLSLRGLHYKPVYFDQFVGAPYAQSTDVIRSLLAVNRSLCEGGQDPTGASVKQNTRAVVLALSGLIQHLQNVLSAR